MDIHFAAFAPDQKIKGMFIAGYKKAIDSAEFAPYFERHGFANVEPDKWYPAQDLMDVFNDIVTERPGALDLVSIGMAAASSLSLPPTLDLHSPEQVFAVMENTQSAAAYSTHPGYVKPERVSSNHYRIQARTVMPDDMLYGITYAFVRNFASPGKYPHLSFPPGGKRRDFGDEYTSLELTWE